MLEDCSRNFLIGIRDVLTKTEKVTATCEIMPLDKQDGNAQQGKNPPISSANDEQQRQKIKTVKESSGFLRA